MRVAAGFGVLDARELPADTPCFLLFLPPRFLVFFLFLSRSPLLFFSPITGIISLKAHGRRRNDEGGTTALRGDCIRSSSRVLAPYPFTPAISFSFPRVSYLRGSLSLPVDGAAAHAPGVSFLSTLRVRASFTPSSVPSLLFSFSFSLLPSLLFLSPSLTHAIYFVFVPPARPVLLARYVRAVRSPHRRVPTRRGGTLTSFARSLARSPLRNHHRRDVCALRAVYAEPEIREMLRRKTRERKRYLERRSRRFSLPHLHGIPLGAGSNYGSN